jgi:hypothetical protein
MEFLDISQRLESFAPCYSQSLLVANFEENQTLPWFKNNPDKEIHETRKLESSHE